MSFTDANKLLAKAASIFPGTVADIASLAIAVARRCLAERVIQDVQVFEGPIFLVIAFFLQLLGSLSCFRLASVLGHMTFSRVFNANLAPVFDLIHLFLDNFGYS